MLWIDKYSRVPIYEQVIAETERQILSGELKSRDALPSVRQLSQELSVNPNTLQKAYAELEKKGLCFSVPGSGRFVSEDAYDILRAEKKKALQEIERLCVELKECGISQDDVMSAVIRAYNGGNND